MKRRRAMAVTTSIGPGALNVVTAAGVAFANRLPLLIIPGGGLNSTIGGLDRTHPFSAMKEFSDLGSGFRVAALDLEIRGAGNLLGGEQSGTIDTVGFEMYMKLLEETIRELKGEDLEDDVRATVNLKVDFRLDDQYVPDINQRLMIYRRMAGSRSEEEIAKNVDEVRDRYGPPPTAVLNLADFARIRVLADNLGIETVDRDGPLVVFKFREKA